MIAIGLGVVAGALVYVGWWIEKHPVDIVKREWEMKHHVSLCKPYEEPPANR